MRSEEAERVKVVKAGWRLTWPVFRCGRKSSRRAAVFLTSILCSKGVASG